MFDKRLLKLVPEARAHIAASVVLQWVGLLATIGLFVLVGFFLQDMLEGGATFDDALRVVIVAVLVIAARMMCAVAAQKQGQAAAAAAKRVVRQRVYDKLVALGPAYGEHVSTAEAVQVSVEGVEQLESYFGSYLPQLVYAVVAPITLFVCLAPLCLPAAVVLLVCVPLIPASIMGVQKFAKRAMRKYWGAYTDLGEVFLENLQGLTTLKVYQADALRHKEMNNEAEGFRRATMRLLSMQLNSITIMDLFAYGGAAVGMVAVLWQYGVGGVAFGAAFAVVFLAAEFFLPMRMLGSFFHTAMSGAAAAEKMFTILEAPEPQRGTLEANLRNVEVCCRGVAHSYDGVREVLQNIDFTAEKCGLVGIVGESGSGKTTLAGILSGRVGSYGGVVRMGGVDARDLSRESLMRTVTTVSSQGYLFKGSVRSNLLLACPSASDADLWRVLAACCMDAFVQELGGLDARVAEMGSNLSGGQRQRLAVARALLHNSPVYVFDEATSNVDAESERAILRVIDDLALRASVIVITHRLASVRDAKCLYVLDRGRLVQKGSHDQLVTAAGVYGCMWHQQEQLEAYSCRLEAGSESGGGTAGDRLSDFSKCGVGEDEVGFSTAFDSATFTAGDLVVPAGPRVLPKQRSHVSVMVRMLTLVRPMAGWVALAVVLGVLGFAAAIFLSVFATYALLDMAGSPQFIAGGVAVGSIVACGLLRGPLRYGEQMCNHYLAFKLLALVRDRVFGALRRLAPAKLEGRDKGDLVSLVTSDIELMEVFYAHTISPVIIALVVSLGATGLIAALSPVLGLLAGLFYLVLGVAVPVIASRFAGSDGRALRAGLGAMNSFVLDSLRGLGETLQYGGGVARSRALSETIEKLSSSEKLLKEKTAFFAALIGALVMLFDIAMVLAVFALYSAGLLDFGGAVVAAAVLMSSFGPVVAVANLGSTLQQTLASGARVLDLLDESPQTDEVTAGVDLGGFAGAAVSQVGFSYQDIRVLEQVDFSITPGSIVHLAGRSGSGKSTLLKLLMRFWDVDQGSVKISSVDVRGINTRSLRAAQSYMTQDTHLFAGSIKQNILLAKPCATPAEVKEACRKAALTEFLDRLPRGLETPLGELGEGLSGGERQRIGLARAFLHDAPLMLLDEPTSNLDALNEATILRALKENRGNSTVVLVSHRVSTAAIADVAYTVDADG